MKFPDQAVIVNSSGAFGLSSDSAGTPLYFQGPDLSGLFQLAEKIYKDIGLLADRVGVRFSKGFEKKLAACSSEILVDMQSKIKILKKTTIDFYRFVQFLQNSLKDLIEKSQKGEEISQDWQVFTKEFARRLDNIVLAYSDRQSAFSMDTFEKCRDQIHQMKLDPKYIKIVESFYSDFAILSKSIHTYFSVKVPRAFRSSENGSYVDFGMLIRDLDEIIGDLANVIHEAEAAEKA